jgi:hypothetical protein
MCASILGNVLSFRVGSEITGSHVPLAVLLRSMESEATVEPF